MYLHKNSSFRLRIVKCSASSFEKVNENWLCKSFSHKIWWKLILRYTVNLNCFVKWISVCLFLSNFCINHIVQSITKHVFGSSAIAILIVHLSLLYNLNQCLWNIFFIDDDRYVSIVVTTILLSFPRMGRTK